MISIQSAPYSGMCVANPTCERGSQGTHHVLRQADVQVAVEFWNHIPGKPPPPQVDLAGYQPRAGCAEVPL